MNLHLMDCSNYIYAGAAHEKYKSFGVTEIRGMYQNCSLPIGGLCYLLKCYQELVTPNDIVVMCFDATPTVKYRLLEESTGGVYKYKGNRTPQPSYLKFEKILCREVAERCNIPCAYADGYEADDLIYTLVKEYQNDFENVYIHTRDSDLAFLVSDNVSIQPTGNTGKVIDRTNYSKAIFKDRNIPYNTIILNKLLYGDTSDNIPPIPGLWIHYNKFFTPDLLPECGDPEFVKSILDKIVKETADATPKINQSDVDLLLKMVVPIQLDIQDIMINDLEETANMEVITNFYLNGLMSVGESFSDEIQFLLLKAEEFLEDY